MLLILQDKLLRQVNCMRIAVCGKGGSGKSTISALLAKQMAKKKNVLVLDIDESNYGLHSQLGLKPPRDLMEYFGGKKGFKEKQREAPKKRSSGGGLQLTGGKPPGRKCSSSPDFSIKDGISPTCSGICGGKR